MRNVKIFSANGQYDGYQIRNLNLNPLESGYVSVSSNTPIGTKNAYKASIIIEGYEFHGTRYLPNTTAKITARGLIKGSTSGGALFVSGATSFIANAVEYGWGSTSLEDFSNRTVENQDFWASFTADSIVGVGTGLLAAGAVAGTIVGLTALGFTAVATAPVLAVVGLTAVVGMGFGVAFNYLGVNNWLQGQINNVIDDVQSWFN